MYLLDLSHAYFRTNFRTNVTCLDEVPHPGTGVGRGERWVAGFAAPTEGLCSQKAPPGHVHKSRR